MRLRAPLFTLSILVEACAASGSPQEPPVLEFPEPGVDDPAAYEGHATRFFRDTRGNAFQVYLSTRVGRVVHVWADAANESAAFTVRDGEGAPAPLSWGGAGARTTSEGRTRAVSWRLAADTDALEIGWFLLGTMRQERDFQYGEWHLRPFGEPAFILPEPTVFVASLERLPDDERARHLELLGASDVEEVRGRLEPRLTSARDGDTWTVLVEHTSLDGRSRMTLELRGDADASAAELDGGRVAVRAPSGERIELDVTVTTDAEPLTALGRERLFNAAFEDYYARRLAEADSLRRTLPAAEAGEHPRLLAFRRLERQVLGLELLSSEEKLMASLPNYATYFGRDQMMSALMLEPISSVDLQELVIASVLRKIDPSGNVSHEEALGGQAIREHAADYAALILAWEADRVRDPEAAADRLARARGLLADLQAVRENYRMVDDDFQLPVLAGRYLARDDVPAERKRRFLTEPASGGPTPGAPRRLDALARNLAFVADLSRPYAERPVATSLVGFFHRDEQGWLPGSWRDSRAGYGGGRFAMDVNVVWVPHALEALEGILASLDELGLSLRRPADGGPGDAALAAYVDDAASLEAAIETWRGARRHFEVRLEPLEIRRRVDALLETMPAEERAYWRSGLDADDAALSRPLSFLALALDAEGRPIAAPSTDPATGLFLGDHTAEIPSGTRGAGDVLEMLDAIARPYPVGLFIEGLGPVVVNDAYASRAVQRRFREDLYHSPRVVWGREVNLLLLGLARQVGAAYDTAGALRTESDSLRARVDAMRGLLEATLEAVDVSGLGHNELWSYRIEGDTLRPVRYGQSSDIQLWNVTDLSVGFLLDGLPPP